jgi:hypothetical protein
MLHFFYGFEKPDKNTFTVSVFEFRVIYKLQCALCYPTCMGITEFRFS